MQGCHCNIYLVRSPNGWIGLYGWEKRPFWHAPFTSSMWHWHYRLSDGIGVSQLKLIYPVGYVPHHAWYVPGDQHT